MSYLTLEQYQRKWIFTHQSMPVPECDLKTIKPMSAWSFLSTLEGKYKLTKP